MTQQAPPPHVLRWARSSAAAAARFEAWRSPHITQHHLTLIPPEERPAALRMVDAAPPYVCAVCKAVWSVAHEGEAPAVAAARAGEDTFHFGGKDMCGGRGWLRWLGGGAPPLGHRAGRWPFELLRPAFIAPAEAWAARELTLRGRDDDR